jgi:hypothetical protein
MRIIKETLYEDVEWTHLAQNVALYRAFWEHGSGLPSCDEGGEFLGRWNKHCFLCYMELLSDILHFASLVHVHNGISGGLFSSYCRIHSLILNFILDSLTLRDQCGI